jgi:hypothetical protein
LLVSGRFVLDEKANPPPLKTIRLDPNGSASVSIGRGVAFRPDSGLSMPNAMYNARVVVDAAQYRGLGSVIDGCAVLCVSNHCRDWAFRNGRPRIVAKIVGVMADVPTYVLLRQPKLKGATWSRRESAANRLEAGLVPFVLIEPCAVECAYCPGGNVGEVSVSNA